MSAYKIVHETWLTRLVSSYGDSALVQLSQEIYKSGLFKIAMLGSATFAFLGIAWSLHQKSFSKRAVFFFMSFLLLTPVSGKPAGYIVVNSVSQALAGVMESAVNRIISNSQHNSQRSNLPPGMVLEMLTAAASSKIESERTQALLQGFVANCLPNALTKTGDHATFDDLFNFETKYSTDPTSGNTVTTFVDRTLDPRALKNDNSYGHFRAGKNCFEGLEELRLALQSELADKPLALTHRVLEGSRKEGEETTSEPWFDNWKARSTHLRSLAMNLRTAHAANYEKSKLISEHGWDFNDPSGSWWQGTGTDASLRELLIAGSGITEFGYRFADFKNVLANSTENRWAFSLGAAIKDLKERIELVPYNLAAIQLLLKIICPIFLMTLFLQTFRFFFMWAGAWFSALLMPSVISASRAIHNSILLSKLGIENLAGSEGTKALAYGVNLSVAKDFLSDFVPLAYSMIEQELAIITALSGVMLFGSWIAGGGANGFVSWIANSIQGNLTSVVMTRSPTAAADALIKAVPLMGKAAGGAASVAGSAVHSIVNSSHQVHDKLESGFSRIFPRRNE